VRQDEVDEDIVQGRAMREADNLIADIAWRRLVKKLGISKFLDARVDERDAEKQAHW
jgi:hypothetical protein